MPYPAVCAGAVPLAVRKDVTMARFLIAPQWQGSASSRAMQLIDGAEAIAGDLPRAATIRLDALMEAGDSLGTGVQRFSAIQRMRVLVDDALRPLVEPALIIGGDCSVSVAGIAHAARRHPGLAVVWADAHPDLHTPASSPSGAFAGMSLRSVLGGGPEVLTLEPGVVDPARVILLGARAMDPAEDEAITTLGIRRLAADALGEPGALAEAVRQTGADAVYVHVDLDVLDPADLPGVKDPEPFGVGAGELVSALKQLRSEVPIVGAAITEYFPASPSDTAGDLGTILRIVGALA